MSMDKPIVSVTVHNCFDPDSNDWENREYSYHVKIDVLGHTREAYFNEMQEAIPWISEKVTLLVKKLKFDE